MNDEYIEALAAFTFATALALLQIDELPQEERTTARTSSFLEDFGTYHAESLSDDESRRLLRMIEYVLDSVEDMRLPDETEP